MAGDIQPYAFVRDIRTQRGDQTYALEDEVRNPAAIKHYGDDRDGLDA